MNSAPNWQGQTGLSSYCSLDPMIVMAILFEAREHPCDRCNMDRNECHGFPRKDSLAELKNNKDQAAEADEGR